MMINDINFFKDFLNKKMSYIIGLKGGIYKPPIDEIFNDLSLSCYEVIWRRVYSYHINTFYHEIIELRKLKSKSYKIESGMIIIDGRALSSSSFIEFSLKDLRDYKINSLLSN
jgi:hypothetical protein